LYPKILDETPESVSSPIEFGGESILSLIVT
jgi:hypothetical protein